MAIIVASFNICRIFGTNLSTIYLIRNNMRKNLILLFFVFLMVSCGNNTIKQTPDRAYALLEQVAELNAGGKKQEAVRLADSALAMTPADTTHCWLLSEKAVALTDMGHMAEAVEVGHQALQLAEKLDDVEAILNMRGALGIAYRRQGKLDSALLSYKKGIELAVKRKNTEYEIYLDNCVAVLYSEDLRFAEALEYSRKAERAAQAANDTIERLSARANVGGVYLKQSKYREALDAVLPMWKEVLGADYNVLTLKYLSVILKSYSALGDIKSVSRYMAVADKAMVGMSSAGNGVLGILEIKADMLGRQGKLQEQLTLLDSLMALNATNLVMPMDRLLVEKAKCLRRLHREGEAYVLMGDAYHRLDSVKQSDVEKSLSDFTVRYQTLEKEMKLEQVQREKLAADNKVLWLGILASVFAIAVCILLYRRKVTAQRAELQKNRSYIQGLENERERMAKELHDGICNDILATTMLLATDAKRAECQLRRVWEDARFLSHALMPPRLQKVSLAEAVRYYVSVVRNESGGNVDLQMDEAYDWGKLPEAKAYETYRIIQEATANAVRHGGDGKIYISLQCNDGIMKVEVINDLNAEGSDGVKEDTQLLSSAGIGAETMRRRAESIGATLQMDDKAGRHIVSLSYQM